MWVENMLILYIPLSPTPCDLASLQYFSPTLLLLGITGVWELDLFNVPIASFNLESKYGCGHDLYFYGIWRMSLCAVTYAMCFQGHICMACGSSGKLFTIINFIKRCGASQEWASFVMEKYMDEFLYKGIYG